MFDKSVLIAALTAIAISAGQDAVPAGESFSYLLPGFSVQSGVHVGDLYQLELAVNETREPADEILFSARNPGNHSEFTVCMRMKMMYHRPEMVLLAVYSENKTALVIGIDEQSEKLYMKSLITEDANELVRKNFPWQPRLDTWEHICLVKKRVEDDNEYKHVVLYVNGETVGNSSAVAAPIDDLTLFVLGQTHPPSSQTAFSGEIAHVGIWTDALSDADVTALATCSASKESVDNRALDKVSYNEGTWDFLVEKTNETEIDHLGIPMARYLPNSEVCKIKPVATEDDEEEKDEFLLPLYNLKSYAFNTETCKGLGGQIADWRTFGEDATALFTSAQIPRVLANPLLAAEDEEPSYTTPLNMQSCFLDGAFVTWLGGESGKREPPEEGQEPPPDNCPNYVYGNGTIVEKCENDPAACSVCVLDNKEGLTLRGLCESSRLSDHRGQKLENSAEFDEEFFPRPDKLTGNVEFRGPFGSRIRKNATVGAATTDEPKEWILESLVSAYREETQAIVKKILASRLPVGRNNWEVSQEACPDVDPDMPTALSLTSCGQKKFTCDNSKCIPVSWRCDKYRDCDDGEDERDCALLEFGDDYKRQEAPRHNSKGVPWEVFVEVEIVAFPEINAIDERLSVVFDLKMRWYEPRVTFRNIKDDKGDISNPLGTEDTMEMWVPRLGLLNGLSEFQTVVNDDTADEYRGYVLREGDPHANDADSDIEDEIFYGPDNSVVLSKQFFQEFTCSFDLAWYPFDYQKCFMQFTVLGQTNETLVLLADKASVKYYGKEFLVEYEVEDRGLYIENRTFSTASVEINFKRRVLYHIFNVYLQSFLLVLTGYMSLYFHVNNFSDRVMVALTVMLVMASLQSAVQDALPKTAYYKLIDWWLLVALNTQIAFMAFHTYLSIKCSSEYRKYREHFYNSKGADNNTAKNTAAEAVMQPTAFMLSTASMASQDEPIGADEYGYPKSVKLNKIVNVVFLAIMLLFNVVYWVAAMIHYL